MKSVQKLGQKKQPSVTAALSNSNQSVDTLFEVTFANGCLYHGPLENGLCHGLGSLTFPSGNIYTGEFVKGVRQGHGEFFYFGTGERYVGQWRNNMKEGRGEYWFNDGSVFKGSFKADVKHGQGEKVSAKLTYSGTWENGKKQGIFKFVKRPSREVKFVEYCDNLVVRVKDIAERGPKNPKRRKLRKKQSKPADTSKPQSRSRRISKPSRSTSSLTGSDDRHRTESRLSALISSRYRHRSKLTEIQEVSETGCSEMSEAPGSPPLFGFEWKKGVNLITDERLDRSIFQFKCESEFENGDFKKEWSTDQVELNSSFQDSTELNKSGTFLDRN